jgi:HSP20 family molecular chaperone IbpA
MIMEDFFEYFNSTVDNLSKSKLYRFEDNEGFYLIKVALPGVDKETIVIKVKNDQLSIEVPEGEFTDEVNLIWLCDTPIAKKHINTEYVDGILSISVKKDGSKEYEVKVE